MIKIFVLANESRYLNEKHEIVKTLDEAIVFDSVKNAAKFYENTPKIVKNLQFITKYVNDKEKQTSVINKPASQLNETTRPKTTDALKSNKKIQVHFDSGEADFDNSISNYIKLLQTTIRDKEKYENDIRHAEAEIQDIMHAAEFYDCDETESYGLCKMLHDVRQKRRHAKNMIMRIAIIENALAEDWLNGNILRKIDIVSNQEYTPRVHNELFENKTLNLK